MARPARIPTPEELKAIVELKSKGMSDTKVAEALSCSRSTLNTWKKNAVGRQEEGSVNTHVEQAIKIGMEARLARHLELAIDATDLLLTKHEYTETKTEYVRIKNKETDKYELVVQKKTQTVKFVMPNPMITIFTKVNRDPENFRSINHPVEKDNDDEMPDGVELEFDE